MGILRLIGMIIASPMMVLVILGMFVIRAFTKSIIGLNRKANTVVNKVEKVSNEYMDRASK